LHKRRSFSDKRAVEIGFEGDCSRAEPAMIVEKSEEIEKNLPADPGIAKSGALKVKVHHFKIWCILEK
jgi:hypothetical protein